MTNCAGYIHAKQISIAGFVKPAAILLTCCLLFIKLPAQLKPYYLFKIDKLNTGVKPFNQTVICMAQDSIGFMWFGTSNGLYRYDGNSFTPFSFKQLNGIEIRSLLVDSKNNLWIGSTWEQLFKYDVHHNTLTHYIFDTATNGDNSSQVYKLCEGKNNQVWLASRQGLLTIQTQTGKFSWVTKNAARTVCVYNDTVWAGMLTGGINCYDASTTRPLATPAPWYFLRAREYSVSDIFPSKNNTLWVGTNLGLFKYTPGGGIEKFYTGGNGINTIPDNYIYSIAGEKDSSYLWISTAKGIALYEEASGGFVPVQDNTDVNAVSVINKSVLNLFRDVSGKIWTGTNGSGIFSFYPRKIKVYRHNNVYAQSIHSNNIKRVFIFNNSLLAAVYVDGIDVINLTTNACNFYPFSNPLAPAFNSIQYPSEKDDHSIFIGASTGLFVFDVYAHTYTPVLPAKYNSTLKNVQAARFDNNNNLWIGCEEENGGLYVYNAQKDSLRAFLPGKKGLQTVNTNLLKQDEEGNMIVCNYSSVQKYMPVADSFIGLSRGGEMLYASAGVCYQSCKDGISLAGSYQNGIYLVNKNLEVLGVIDEAKGLSSNTILSFLPADSNSIWAATFWGINHIAFNNTAKTAFTISHIDNSDGLPGEMVINMVARNSAAGKTYFLSTTDGLVEAKESAFASNKFVPPVVITSLTIDDKLISAQDSSHILAMPVYLTKQVNLSYTQNSFQVTFAALNYISAQKNRYAYKLQGVDKDWRYTSNVYSASYSNLRPGTYVFFVKASNDAGVWNAQDAQLTFIIKPPFWQTNWAYVLYVLSIGAVVYGIYVTRIRQLRAKQQVQLKTMIATQEEERRRISRDLHDDVGTRLSALKLFVSTFKSNLQKQNYTETEALAKSTEELIDEAIRDVRVMLTNLSPGILEEFGYITAVEGLVNKINEAKAIEIKLVVFGVNQRFSREYELALYRITQELINNVLKHARAKHALLQVGYRNGNIILMMEDDGRGFDVTRHKEGYGLKNIEARAKLLQGTMNIDSLPGNGTSVLIEIPYQFM